ncbi:monofunctional biosynthetic peptidoglycan transglycosylase [Myxococcus sp. K15C18031901]|uniref:monofunctional biosynthetic peptidoglycan transglycosylase n=1 Tax=Myxococcus dinghuensis TaxID=2906761 RepID=UPI0020A8234A|nr:monofunctional biosynthetic peptidoglycan transglycosylase [Myxococcus dinghuensis]MCP3099769.1 monofunctional biosynthetic peptidoglycan transglycosylase [Myxococcus dinghuensis]
MASGPTGASPVTRRARWRRRVVLALGLLVFGVCVVEYVRLPEAEPLVKENPKSTALMDQRAEEAREAGKKARRRQHWVSLGAISRHAVAAVLVSEDAGFYVHEGVDTVEVRKAMEEAWKQGKLGRGASTITQQLAKNLWLSTDRSLLRKAKELVLAHRLEEALPKKRILALYLNVVEWGSGVYGIEAGAREHFGVSASQLTPAQGAILAAMLPAPRKRSPSSGSRALWKRAHWIVDQLASVGRLSGAEADTARADIDRLLGRAPAETTDAADDDTDGEG